MRKRKAQLSVHLQKQRRTNSQEKQARLGWLELPVIVSILNFNIFPNFPTFSIASANASAPFSLSPTRVIAIWKS